MRRLLATIFVLGLVLCIGTAQAGQGGNCSPEGTWYGDNTFGAQWIVTITRSGPNTYTTVMDEPGPPWEGATHDTDWRGELVKTGPHQYAWTTMAYALAEVGGPWSPFEFLLGHCPLTAEFTSCDSWEGSGICDFYGYFLGQDSFEEAIYVLSLEELQASFKRMPMTFPVP